MAALFWVGGTGNWSDATNHWATSSGGAPGAGNLPTAADDVTFDTLSNATAYTVTIDATSKVCKSLTMGAPLAGKVTWAGSVQITISGSLNLSGGTAGITRTYTGTLIFNATSGTSIITSNGVTLASPISVTGAGGTVQLADTLNIGSAGITHSAGTLDFNGKTVTIGGYTGSGTSTLTMGAAAVTCSGAWTMVAGQTLTANTATITMSGAGVVFTGGGKTYNNVTFTGAFISGGIGTAIVDTNTFNNLTLTGTAITNGELWLGASQTVTGTFTSTGNSTLNRLLIIPTDTAGSVRLYGTTRTITAAAITMSNTDFINITGAGAGSWTGTSIGDCGGNSGITFTTPVTRYWVATTGGNWGVTTSWSSTSGGGSGSSIPLPQDTVIFDSNSITSGGRVITMNSQRYPGISFNGVLNTPAISWSNTALIFYIVGGLDLTGTSGNPASLHFWGRTSVTLNTNGLVPSPGVTFENQGGTVTLAANLSTGAFTHTIGAFDASTFSVTLTASFTSTGSLTRTLSMGTNTWTLSSSATTPWNIAATGLTLNCNTSTLKFTDTANGAMTIPFGALTYYKIWFSRGASTGTLTLSNAFICNNFTDDGTGAHTITWTKSTTYTFTTFNVSGGSGHVITMNTNTAGTAATLSAASGIISCDWLSIKDSTATGGASWYAGANSTSVSGNSGWIFTAPPSTGKGGTMLLLRV